MSVSKQISRGHRWLYQRFPSPGILPLAEPAALRLAMVALVVVLGAANAHAESEATKDPSLNESLVAAMNTNPSIITMKAKLALAEAELNDARLEIAQKVVAAWNEVDRQKQLVAVTRERFEQAEVQYKSGQLQILELSEPKTALVNAEAALARARSELEFLVGKSPTEGGDSGYSAAGAMGLAAPVQIPRGPLVDHTRKALRDTSELNFVDQPLVDVLEFLQDLNKITIAQDPIIHGNTPVTMKLRGAPLGVTLQAIEDFYPEIVFVVRDYGILATSPEQARKRGYMPVREFVKLSDEIEPAAIAKPAAPTDAKPVQKTFSLHE